MPKAHPVEIPLVNVNDETVKLTAWLVKDGDEVHEGQTLAELETSKALVELAAPINGRVHLKYAAGDEIAVGAVVAYIGDQMEELIAAHKTAAASASAGAPAPASLPAGTRFSKKALELIATHGLSPEAFVGHALVREQDVLDQLEKISAHDSETLKVHHAFKGISLEGLSLPAILWDTESGRVESQFLEGLRKHPEAFVNLPSEEKCRAYREHGARIGADVQIGRGTLILAPQIQLGDRVKIGENSSIILRERFSLGELSSFREGLSVRGGTAVFGTNTFAGSRIQIGGGGNADPWALLVSGDSLYLGDDVFINICRPVLIGREVFLTQRSILVTHNIGHSVLEGCENAFAPIVLEDFAQVGMNATLYAGSRVGHSAIIASNSYVISSIPKRKLAMGVPATVARDAARSIDHAKKVQIAEAMLRQFQELLALKGVEVSSVEPAPILHFSVKHAGKTFRVAFVEAFSQELSEFPATDESVLWTLDSSCAPPPAGVVLIDLLAKTYSGPAGIFGDSNREFLRKRGIRLEPGPWRYQKGLI